MSRPVMICVLAAAGRVHRDASSFAIVEVGSGQRAYHTCVIKQTSWARCSRPATKAPARSENSPRGRDGRRAIHHALARPPVVTLTVGISFFFDRQEGATARHPAVTTVVVRCCGHPVGGVRWSSASPGAPPPSSGTLSRGTQWRLFAGTTAECGVTHTARLWRPCSLRHRTEVGLEPLSETTPPISSWSSSARALWVGPPSACSSVLKQGACTRPTLSSNRLGSGNARPADASA